MTQDTSTTNHMKEVNVTKQSGYQKGNFTQNMGAVQNIQYSDDDSTEAQMMSKPEGQLSHLTVNAPTKNNMIVEPRRCSRCDKIGHTADACIFFAKEREDHPDAEWGDTTPHLQQTNISITVEGQVVESNQRLPGWWNGKELEISVDNIWFVLGSASGEGCNCLIDTLRQHLPSFVCDVALVRAELERRHARGPTALLPLDYLDLAMYWSDIIDIIGEKTFLAEHKTFLQNFVFVA